MRKHRKKEISSLVLSDSTLSSQRETGSSARLPSDYSPPIPPVIGMSERGTSSFSIDVHLTVRSLVELSRRKVSLLLENYLYRVTLEGFDLKSYLYIEWMNSYLRGSRNPEDLKDEKERIVVRLSDLVLESFRNQDIQIDSKSPVDTEVIFWIRELLDPTGRKFSSRRIYYQLEKFLCFRTVPVTSVYERDGHSNRYSSYCKGYGESSRMGRRQKTKISFELDGKDPGEPGKISLDKLGIYFSLNLLELKLRIKRA